MRKRKLDLSFSLLQIACVGLATIFPAAIATAEDLVQEAVVRGVVRSANQATLSTDIRAKVVAINFREGEEFVKGDVLVEFDCRSQRARLAAAKAFEAEKMTRLQGAKYLEDLNAGNAQDVQIASAQVDQAKADIEVLNLNLEGCILRAPFDGVVFERHVRENERSTDGAPILSIVNVVNPEIELIVPSNWIGKVGAGEEFAFRIDETGDNLQAVIRRTSPIVDPVSQTVRMYAEFKEQHTGALPGMSGDATFKMNLQGQ